MTPPRAAPYQDRMSWIGQEHGEARCWGPDGVTRDRDCAPEARMIVGAPNVPADSLPGNLLPAQLARAPDGLHLPPLEDLPAPQRLRLLGFQTLNPDWDGLAVMPCDSRTYWATLSAGELIHLRISATPGLARALGAAEEVPQGLDEAMARAEALPFELARAGNRAEVLGLLLGAEMAGSKSLWLGQQAVLIGQGAMARAYLSALQGLYVPVTETSEDAVLREGFRALAKKFVAPV